MAALAEPAEGLARSLGLIGGDGHDLRAGHRQEPIEVPASGIPLAAFEHEAGLDARRCRDQPNGIRLDQPIETRAFRLIEQNGSNCRGIQDHQRATPYSS